MVGRIAIVVMVLGLTLMWIYALWGHPDVPGRLDDTTFPTAAQPICEATVKQIDALPKAHETRDPASRAAVVDQATTDLELMLDQLTAVVPTEQPTRDMVTQWLADWRTYTADRRAYTAQLRTDPTTRFAVTQSDRDNVQITGAVDRFAKVNNMAACATPLDVT